MKPKESCKFEGQKVEAGINQKEAKDILTGIIFPLKMIIITSRSIGLRIDVVCLFIIGEALSTAERVDFLSRE